MRYGRIQELFVWRVEEVETLVWFVWLNNEGVERVGSGVRMSVRDSRCQRGAGVDAVRWRGC